jgi:DNA-binding SARP family transcriptional activator
VKERAAHLAKGIGALAVLVVLVVGVPWALVHFVGWPLPHHVPSAAEVGRALDHQGIPAQTLVDALAVVVWVAWATLLASLAVEIPAALAGRHAGRLPLAGAFQPLTGRLVAAVVVACLTLAPRPAHLTPGLSTNPGGTLAPRPTPALVVRDDAFTARLTPVRTSPALVSTAGMGTAAPAQTTGATPPSPAPVVAPRVYVVQRGDTLWGIAERELGDPLEWSEIFQMNEGRPQPGGVTLTEPHWIDPGWTLLLPASSTTGPAPGGEPPSPTTGQAPPAVAQPAPVVPTPPTTPPPATPPVTTTPVTTAPPPQPHVTSPRRAETVPAAPSSGGPVRLPSGSVVAGSFAAGVVATVAVGRLRRRHAYRYRPPRPGRHLGSEPSRPTIDHLRDAARASGAIPDAEDAVPVMPAGTDERICDPGRLEVGVRRDEAVALELTELSGIAIEGEGADDVVRAVVAGLVVRAEPGAAEVLLPEDLAGRLLPGLCPHQSIRVAASPEQAARLVESERVGRARRFEALGATFAGQFRAENPEHPLPLLLVLLDPLTAESLGRWQALVADAPRFAIAVVFLAPSPVATGTIRVDAAHRVTEAAPSERLGLLAGVQLFGLRAEEATEVLAALGEAGAGDEEDLDDDPSDAGATLVALRTPGAPDGVQAASAPRDDEPGEPWPETSPAPPGNDDGRAARPVGVRPITVRMFGHFEVAVDGEVIASGLRSRARDVLAWCLLRPEGATSDEAVEALWPDTAPERVHAQFWRSFSELRARLRDAGRGDLEVLVKAGEHYRPCAAEIACDLWELQGALGEASRARDPEEARLALRRAVDAFRGELLVGMDRPWVEPVRQDLHRRCLDAYLRLAELEDQTGRPDAAVEVLEQAIARDRYAEEPYRRLMALHGAYGRTSAVAEVWKALRGHLAELDLDVEPATAALYRQLTAEQQLSRFGLSR